MSSSVRQPKRRRGDFTTLRRSLSWLRFVHRGPLLVEQLEHRRLLAIDLTGVPTWVEQGPGTMLNGNNVEGIPNQPQAGAVNALAPDLTNADRLFAATTNGGVWRTNNATAAFPSWVPLTDQFGSLSIGDIAFSPLDPTMNTLYAGAGRFSSGFGDGGPQIGLLKSTDGGDTWSLIEQNVLAGTRIVKIAPTALGTPDTQVVLVATNTGIYRSADGGVTFGATPVLAGNIRDLDADPANPNRFYAAFEGTGNGFFISTTGGMSWNPINNNIPVAVINNSDFTQMAVHNSPGSNAVYAVTFDNQGMGTFVLNSFRSIDQGTTWMAMDQPPMIGIPRRTAIAADPNDPNVVYIASVVGQNTANCNRPSARTSRGDASQAAGSQWMQVICDNAAGTSPHPDARDLVFDANGDLLEANDGGIYRLLDPNNAGRVWESVNGNLRTVEFYGVAYDALNNSLFGGTQDNGTPQQTNPAATPGGPPPTFTWFDRTGGDGGVVQVDNTVTNCLLVVPCSIHYESNQNLGGFTRDEYDNTNVEVLTTSINLQVTGAGPVGMENDLFGIENALAGGTTIQFMQPWTLNKVDPDRLIIGTNFLYESMNQGTTITSLGGPLTNLNADGNDNDQDLTSAAVIPPLHGTDEGDEFAPTGPVGAVNPTGTTGNPLSNPIAYGGRAGGVPNPAVLWIGAGGNLFLRTMGGGLPTMVPQYTAAGGAAVVDIVLDPEDWHVAFILDANGTVFRAVTDDPGTTTTFQNLTGNLGSFATDLRTIEFVRGSDMDILLLVGGQLGVYRAINPETTPPVWSEVGLNLPNAIAQELAYDATVDLLAVATFGRGMWTLADASLVLDQPPVLTICGDEDHINQDDAIRLVRSSANPLLLDVYLNSVLRLSMPMAALQQINVFGVGGNDELIVDTSNGLITVPDGIRYDGDGACLFDEEGHAGAAGFDRGIDTLTITTDTPDFNFTNEDVAIGQLPGVGRHQLTGTENGRVAAQTVWFEELEPINSMVAAAELRIASIPGSASLLREANTINFDNGGELVLDAGTVDDDGAPNPSTTSFEGDNSLSNQNDFYNGQSLRFTAGGLAGQQRVITDYDGVNRFFTFASGFSAAPADGDTFEIVVEGSRVTVDAFEPITFANKENVVIAAGAGNDKFFGSSDTLPFRLMRLTVNGQDGDDSITFVDFPPVGSTNLIGVEVNGGEGDDFVDVSGVTVDTPFNLFGNDGRDFLLGGPGDDMLGGGTGDDTLIGGDPAISGDIGDNTYDGGDGFDTVVVRGTSAGDVMDIFQPAPSGAANGDYSLVSNVNGNTDSATIVQDSAGQPGQAPRRPTVEEIRVAAGTGNDLIRVGHSDDYADGNATNGIANQTLRFHVLGDAPAASDRLIVRDDGTGDLVLVRPAVDGGSGRVSVAPGIDGGLGDVVYEGIERLDILPVDPVTGGTGDASDGRIVVFQPDPFELNDNRLIPTEIAAAVSPLNPNIDPAGVTNPFGDGFDVPGDEDWFEFRTPKVGTFRFDVFFEEIATVPSGRQGLPGNGQLGIVVYDRLGNVIVHGRDNASGDGASAAISAAAGNVYYLRVRGGSEAFAHAESINTYSVRVQEIDVLGPQVYDPVGAGPAIQIVTAGAPNQAFDLFDLKPTTGPTPLVDGLLINVRDLLSRELSRRAPGEPLADIYGALDLLAAGNPGNYRVVGDHNGIMPITTVEVVNAPTSIAGSINALPAPAMGAFAATLVGVNEPLAGDMVVFENGPAGGQVREIATYDAVTGAFTFVDPFLNAPAAGDAFTVLRIATATLQLNFAEPLPDDRYSLTIDDSVVDPSGNSFDGEDNAHQPNPPSFPSGDRLSGGDFHARFTVDSRPEIGVWAAGTVAVDTNGNLLLDPRNADYVNRDIFYSLGFTSDDIFAGNFAGMAGNADGFDKLAAYGRFEGRYRWLVDTDNDGVPNLNVIDPASVNGHPVAGDFDGNPANGDEVGVFDGHAWYLDSDHDYQVDNPPLPTTMSGYPVVGDFDGDGTDDLATWSDDVFQIDLDRDGFPDHTFRFGFIGVREEPVSADLDQDGFDDLGLWVPDREAVPSSEAADWYFLVSGGTSLLDRIVPADDPLDGRSVIEFTPIPFGNDIYAQFGDEFARPVVGNFDPPIGPVDDHNAVLSGQTNPINPWDVNADGFVSPIDALHIIHALNQGQVQFGLYYDTSGDGSISPIDVLYVISKLSSSKLAPASLSTSTTAAALAHVDFQDRSRSPEINSTPYTTFLSARPQEIKQPDMNVLTGSPLHFLSRTDELVSNTRETTRSTETDLVFSALDSRLSWLDPFLGGKDERFR